jgi:hypothetical protein
MRFSLTLAVLIPLVGGCMEYVPANLPIELKSGEAAESATYQDELGRTIGAADADGPEYRLTLQNGTQFFMKNPRMQGDSIVGYYRPTKGSSWARASVELVDVRLVEEERVDWLATMSLATVPITLGLLLTLD